VIRHLILWLLCLAAAIVSLAWQLVAIFGSPRRALRIAVGFDQTANAAFGGDEDETISSRAWRLKHKRGWGIARRVIDWGFNDKNHCRDAYQHEVWRRSKF